MEVTIDLAICRNFVRILEKTLVKNMKIFEINVDINICVFYFEYVCVASNKFYIRNTNCLFKKD